MSETHWDHFGMEQHIREILTEVGAHPEGGDQGHPFLTAYQLAIALDRREPQIAREMGRPVGGRGSGRPTLADYIAQMLITRQIDDIECGRLSWQDIAELSFNPSRGGPRMKPSVRPDRVLHVFRLRL